MSNDTNGTQLITIIVLLNKNYFTVTFMFKESTKNRLGNKTTKLLTAKTVKMSLYLHDLNFVEGIYRKLDSFESNNSKYFHFTVPPSISLK